MAPPLLTLQDVHLTFGGTPLLEGAELSIGERERVCLVGRNGSGKSTLLRLLAGRIEPDAGERFAQPALRVTLLEQEPTITGDSLADYAAAGGAPRHDAEAALQAFGLDPADATSGLSGGEARRAALARAFAEAPNVLLLDEPTNHLDILAIEALEAMITASRAAVLVVSHDRAFLGRVSRRTFWLESRKVRTLAKSFAAFEPWAEKLAAEESEADRRLEKAIEREAHWLARGVTARRARNEGRRRRLIALRQEKAARLRLARGDLAMGAAAADPSGRRVIEAHNLAKAFGEKILLKGFSARILRGDRVAVIGPNGAGKTTLVKLLLGQLRPDTGHVKLGVGLEVAYVDQARADLADSLTLVQALAPLGGDQVMVGGKPRHVAAYARDFLFRDDQLRQPVASLSGGERNRLLLARALARPSNVLVLDEPTNDLDLETLDLLEEILADYEGTLILVSHDRDFIDRLATSTIALDGRGRAVETPGGWQSFVEQNPDFLAPPTTAKPVLPARAAARTPPPAPAKLSFKDQRRLAALEAAMPKLAGEIARLEASLTDAGLYGRDPEAFATVTAELAATRAELAAAEEAWLDLEGRREALASGNMGTA